MSYREISPDEQVKIDEVRKLERTILDGIAELETGDNAVDRRALAVARTHVQTAFMWLVRAIAHPDS